MRQTDHRRRSRCDGERVLHVAASERKTLGRAMMTRDDMMDIVEHSIRYASTKSVVEDLWTDISRDDVEKFFNRVAGYIENAIDNGDFDE
jgi:hypothetical protein